jgi:molybdopterin-guanine dinucleotide biosynthesis protein A
MGASNQATGLILAGGAGRRVQGRDKGLIDWQGRPLVAHVAQRLRPQVDRMLISCNRNIEQYARFADGTVSDTRRDFQGPLAGIEAAIPLLDSDFLVVVACDTPKIPVDLVERLLQPLLPNVEGTALVSYAHDGARDQYLCAAMHRRCLQSLPAYLDEGGRAVRHWYGQYRCSVVDFSAAADAFANYNRIAH